MKFDLRFTVTIGVLALACFALWLSFLLDKSIFGVVIGAITVSLSTVIRHLFPTKNDTDQKS